MMINSVDRQCMLTNSIMQNDTTGIMNETV